MKDQDKKAISNIFDLNLRQKPLTDDQLQQMRAAAEKEREELLNKRPELKKFQKKIDRLMNNAGSFEKRMTMLGTMMEANLKELQKQLTELSRRVENWKKS